ncbi:uncharacterized protein METZ01_LOCUS323440, partial [marine metagenome]
MRFTTRRAGKDGPAYTAINQRGGPFEDDLFIATITAMYTKEITGRHLFSPRSLVDEFEFLRSLARWSVRLSCFGTPVEDVDPLGGLFTTFRLGPRETTVTRSDSTESALTPLQFACTALLDALNGVHRVTPR